MAAVVAFLLTTAIVLLDDRHGAPRGRASTPRSLHPVGHSRLLQASWASSDACIRQAFITPANGTPIPKEAGRDYGTWYHALRRQTSAYKPHQLVPLTVSGAPCGGLLTNWSFYMRAHSLDVPTFKQVILDHEFEFLRALFPLGRRQPATIIDLGGNFGMATLYMATLFPDARIVLVEPSVSNFLTARANTAHMPHVYQEHAAVGPTGFSKVDSLDVNGQGISSEVMHENGLVVRSVSSLDRVHSMAVVPSIGIPHIMRKYQMQAVGFLKIDIEGAEKLLFGPEGDSDEWLPLVTCLSMEVHKQALPQDWEQSVFKPAMQRHGFKFILTSGELTVWCNSKKYRGEPAHV